MTCQARILDVLCAEVGMPPYHSTKECGVKSAHKISIDRGYAVMHICTNCKARFDTQKNRESLWYGWFDCEYPAGAQVKFSPWYHEQLALKKATANAIFNDVIGAMKTMTISASMSSEPIVFIPAGSVEPVEAPAPAPSSPPRASPAPTKKTAAVAKAAAKAVAKAAAKKKITELANSINDSMTHRQQVDIHKEIMKLRVACRS